jgi:LysR family transcriptional repressor of citA
VETRNFSATAKNLSITQSTVSKRIQELEKEMGHELFVRGRAGVKLTKAGNALSEYAEQIVNMEEKALSQINYTRQYSGYLILGTVYAYYDLYLGKHLCRFTKMCPEISVRVKFGHSGLMLSEVRRGQIDIAFTHNPFQHPEYVCKNIEEDDVILVTDAANLTYLDGIPHTRVKELPLLSSNFLYATTQSWLFPRHQQFQLEVASRPARCLCWPGKNGTRFWLGSWWSGSSLPANCLKSLFWMGKYRLFNIIWCTGKKMLANKQYRNGFTF